MDYSGYSMRRVQSLSMVHSRFVISLIMTTYTPEKCGRSTGILDMTHTEMLASMKLQLDRMEAKLDVMADSAAATAKAASKKIDPNGYYSYTEAAEIVGVSESTLRRLARLNKLRTVKIGERIKFVGNDLLVFQRERDKGIRILGE